MSMDMFDATSDDPLTKERAQCMQNDHHVHQVLKEMKECQNRLEKKPYTAETCAQEMVDLMHAVDHCVGDKAFVQIV